MNISGTELRAALARSVSVTEDALIADLADGRTITVPLAWFPRLAHGKLAERNNWRPSPVAKESTGRIWMKTSAWRAFWRTADRARPRSLFDAGCRHGRLASD